MMTPTPTKQRKTTDFMASYLVTSKSTSTWPRLKIKRITSNAMSTSAMTRFRFISPAGQRTSVMYLVRASRQNTTRNAVSGMARSIPVIPPNTEPQKKIAIMIIRG